MRTFNPVKELNKIQKGNKNKIILGVCLLLLIIAIGSSYALYQIKYNKQIIYTKVEPFYSKDMQLAVYVNGVKQDKFPEKSDDILYGGYECEKGSKITFNNNDWSVTLKTNKPDKCNIIFGNKYEDKSGANYPELYQGLIPIYFKEGKIYVADVTSKWYDYDEHEWANAVLIDNTNPDIQSRFYDENGNLRGRQEVEESDILQMYVWIPRYKYELFNVDNKGVPKQIINIKFEEGVSNTGNIKCTYTNNGDGTITEDCKDKDTEAIVKNTDWYTHPAFTFKGTTEESGTELPGIWVGKFESSDPTNENGRANTTIDEIAVLPNKTSVVKKTIKTMFEASQAIETTPKYNLSSVEIDTHMMKNMEWGAVAYLSQSIYGIYTKDGEGCVIEGMDKETCKVWINNTVQGAIFGASKYVYGGTYTGCVGDSVNAVPKWNDDDNSPAKCDSNNVWTKKGVNASTTGNMYGIYDMNGGAYDFVMGVIATEDGTKPYYARSGFSDTNMPDKKYYDLYEFGTEYTTFERGHLGDATREILKLLENADGGWNGEKSHFVWISGENYNAWFRRGGANYFGYYYDEGSRSGIFSSYPEFGKDDLASSFRIVLTDA